MKTMIATRDFKDAGTGRAFAAGHPIEDVSAAILGNYEAAGLASADGDTADAGAATDAEAAAATVDTPTPAKRKAAPRRRKAAAAS